MRPSNIAWLALSLFMVPAATNAAEPVPLAAQGCAGCHGVRGTGADPIARLAGRPASEISGQMTAFATNQRPGTIMGRIARGYTDEQIAAIAAYFAAQR